MRSGLQCRCVFRCSQLACGTEVVKQAVLVHNRNYPSDKQTQRLIFRSWQP